MHFQAPLHDTTCCQTGCQTGLTTGCVVYTNIQPVVKAVWQPVWEPVVSCKRGFRDRPTQACRRHALARHACVSLRFSCWVHRAPGLCRPAWIQGRASGQGVRGRSWRHFWWHRHGNEQLAPTFGTINQLSNYQLNVAQIYFLKMHTKLLMLHVLCNN